MDPKLLNSLRSYLQSQQEHLLQQQTEQEWLLGEITISLAKTQTCLLETRRILSLQPSGPSAPPSGGLAALMPSFVPSFLSRPFLTSPVEEEAKPERQQQQQAQPAASRKRSASLSALDDADAVDQADDGATGKQDTGTE